MLEVQRTAYSDSAIKDLRQLASETHQTIMDAQRMEPNVSYFAVILSAVHKAATIGAKSPRDPHVFAAPDIPSIDTR